jgi:antitoxin component YwqK of YwqJK toxin-antitoxin module
MVFQTTTIVASDRDRDRLVGPAREVVQRWIHWNDKVPTSVVRTLYDQEGRVLEVHSWQEAEGKLVLKSNRKALYEYDDHKRLIKLIAYGEEGSITRTVTYSYDEKGHKTGEIARDDKGREEIGWTYSWDDRGNMKEMRSYRPDGHPLADVKMRSMWEYDSQDRVVQSMVYRSEGTLPEKSLYKYDDKGLLSELIGLESNASVRRREVFHYDQSGRRMEELDFNAEGSLTFRTTHTYEDDARGNWIKETPGRWNYDKSGKPDKWPTEVITRTITYYPIGDAQK